jgi:hypothetical protein
MCLKTTFRDEKEALFYIDKLRKTSKRSVLPIRAYLCEKCLLWHLTSKDDKTKIKIERLEKENNNLKNKIKNLRVEIERLKCKLSKNK